jgi:hypothetical protein
MAGNGRFTRVRRAAVAAAAGIGVLAGGVLSEGSAYAATYSTTFEVQNWHCATAGHNGWVVSLSGATLNPSGDTKVGPIGGNRVTLNGWYGHNDFYSAVTCAYRDWYMPWPVNYPGIGVVQGVWISASGRTFRI